MKKTLLILFSLCLFSKIEAPAQSKSDTSVDKDNLYYEYKKNIKWNVLSFYYSVLPGFQIYSRDSANATVAIPVGINYRHYINDKAKLFYTIDASNILLVLDRTSYTALPKLT